MLVTAVHNESVPSKYIVSIKCIINTHIWYITCTYVQILTTRIKSLTNQNVNNIRLDTNSHILYNTANLLSTRYSFWHVNTCTATITELCLVIYWISLTQTTDNHYKCQGDSQRPFKGWCSGMTASFQSYLLRLARFIAYPSIMYADEALCSLSYISYDGAFDFFLVNW